MQDITELKKQIMASELLAKTVLQCGEQVEIVAVYKESKYHYCFFTFTAPKPNSKPEKWVAKGCHSIYQGKYMTLDDMVNEVIRTDFKGKMLWREDKLFVTQDELADHLHNITHPAPQQPPPGATFDIVARKSLGGRQISQSWIGAKKSTIRFVK